MAENGPGTVNTDYDSSGSFGNFDNKTSTPMVAAEQLVVFGTDSEEDLVLKPRAHVSFEARLGVYVQ